MIDKVRIDEARRNVKIYVEDGLFSIMSHRFIGKSIGTNYLD